MHKSTSLLLILVTFCCFPFSVSSQEGGGGMQRGNSGGNQQMPLVRGSITTINQNSASIKQSDGIVQTVNISSRTEITKKVTLSENQLKVGDNVMVRGHSLESGGFFAQAVTILDDTVAGSQGNEPRGGGPNRQGAPLWGKISTCSPESISLETYPSKRIEITPDTKLFKESIVDISQIKSGCSVFAIAPQRPGSNGREAIKIILLDASEENPSASAKSPAPGAKTARIAFDYARDAGQISKYIAGVTSGAQLNSDSYELLKKNGCRLVEVTVWLSRPKRSAHDAMFLKASESMDTKEHFQQNMRTAKQQIKKIFEIGSIPLVMMISSRKPDNFTTYRKEVADVLNELNAAAKSTGNKLSLFRFGNEPESKDFWNSTREDFFETFDVWAQVVKKISPDSIIDAPGFLSPTKRFLHDRSHDDVNDFTKSFLEYCDRNNVPLDIFSFHYYNTELDSLAQELGAVQKILAKYPTLSPKYGTPKIGIDEWNIRLAGFHLGKYFKIFDSSYTAAHNIGALITMLQSEACLSIRFGGTMNPSNSNANKAPSHRSSDKDFLLVNSKGKLKPVYHAYTLFNRLFRTRNILKGIDEEGCLAIAGKSDNGEKIAIMISLYNAEEAKVLSQVTSTKLPNWTTPVSLDIKLINLPAAWQGKHVQVSRSEITENGNARSSWSALVGKGLSNSELQIKLGSQRPAVVLIEIEQK